MECSREHTKRILFFSVNVRISGENWVGAKSAASWDIDWVSTQTGRKAYLKTENLVIRNAMRNNFPG